MLENLRLSFQGIWSHKMRSFLTMLGIIIGIAAIIAIVSTIKGCLLYTSQGNGSFFKYGKRKAGSNPARPCHADAGCIKQQQ